jgi:hypothetical protein
MFITLFNPRPSSLCTHPLSDAILKDSEELGIKLLNRVRILPVETIPLPSNEILRKAILDLGFIGKNTIGISFRYGIFVQVSHYDDKRLIIHELTHTMQYERAGGIYSFLKQYVVEANLEGIGFTKLSSDLLNHSTTLDVGKDTFVNEQFSGLKNENHIALIVMVSLLNDILMDQPIQNQNLSTRNDARIQCGYYGYTIGWGWTQEQAVDHESCVRDSACENIQRYSCEYLGSSTTCGFGAIGCVTISTFRCDDGKACN